MYNQYKTQSYLKVSSLPQVNVLASSATSRTFLRKTSLVLKRKKYFISIGLKKAAGQKLRPTDLKMSGDLGFLGQPAFK
jgi:hypothetical protein